MSDDTPGNDIWTSIRSDRPATPFASGCASRVVLDHVTSKWGVLVLASLAERPRRWGELHRHVEGISEKMLAQTLRALESDGFVLRDSHGTVPPRVDYSLTALGEELAELLIPLVRWVGENVGRTGVVLGAAS
ncbi:helix-turn-helix transcriptional regulator [Herbiconiux moechotypicola]|uniref:HTH hxlR-type domain-containing protein n=1 Tax=Herbiconiux moechotypicola TaxID=637393 RepID=A0ABN3DNG5_9MICO|nr:helix-turn-helix domain-containing protein [Herbiconiux moechotypicola]MCS5730382.1 helix-turn-helix transcriptional regulator [Herbiconiux moechotypicola]